jgi:hypothetical protein
MPTGMKRICFAVIQYAFGQRLRLPEQMKIFFFCGCCLPYEILPARQFRASRAMHGVLVDGSKKRQFYRYYLTRPCCIIKQFRSNRNNISQLIRRIGMQAKVFNPREQFAAFCSLEHARVQGGLIIYRKI